MYKILICDDEKWIRKGLIAKIQYHKFEFSKIIEAVDGEDAMQVIEKENPDIVITDVKMPNLTGIDLLKKCHALYPKIKFIMISGYAEYEYVSQAINIGAEGYILKPICDEDLISKLNKVIEELNSQNEISVTFRKQQELETKNEEYILQNELNKILHSNNCVDYENKLSTISNYISADSKYMMALIVIQIDEANKLNQLMQIKNEVTNLLKENRKSNNALVLDDTNDTDKILIVYKDFDEINMIKDFEKYIIESISELKKKYDIDLYVAFSGVVDKLSNTIYKQAKRALEIRIINNKSWIYRYTDINNDKLQTIEYPKQKLILFSKYLHDEDSENACLILKTIFTFNKLQINDIVSIKFLLSECIYILVEICNMKHLEVDAVIPYKLLTSDRIINFCNIDEIVLEIKNVIDKINNYSNKYNYNTKTIVKKLKQYIDEHFNEELNVHELAKKFLINANYLSNLFSKETGYTITKYITKVRIEKACELIKETLINISDISESVGYQDHQYFYRVFKKETNMTPSEYRSKIFMENLL